MKSCAKVPWGCLGGTVGWVWTLGVRLGGGFEPPVRLALSESLLLPLLLPLLCSLPLSLSLSLSDK